MTQKIKTTKGYVVAGLQKAFSVRTYSYRGFSGRIRVIEGDPYFDEYEKWDDEGKAWKHDFGDLDLKTASEAV